MGEEIESYTTRDSKEKNKNFQSVIVEYNRKRWKTKKRVTCVYFSF